MLHIKTVFQNSLDAKYNLQREIEAITLEAVQLGDNTLGEEIGELASKLNGITAPFTGEDGAMHVCDMFDKAIERRNDLQAAFNALAMKLMTSNKLEIGKKIYAVAQKLSEITAPFVGDGE